MEVSKSSRWETTKTSPSFPLTAPILPVELASLSSMINQLNQAEVAIRHVPKPTTYKEKGRPILGNVVGGSCGGS